MSVFNQDGKVSMEDGWMDGYFLYLKMEGKPYFVIFYSIGRGKMDRIF